MHTRCHCTLSAGRAKNPRSLSRGVLFCFGTLDPLDPLRLSTVSPSGVSIFSSISFHYLEPTHKTINIQRHIHPSFQHSTLSACLCFSRYVPCFLAFLASLLQRSSFVCISSISISWVFESIIQLVQTKVIQGTISYYVIPYVSLVITLPTLPAKARQGEHADGKAHRPFTPTGEHAYCVLN